MNIFERTFLKKLIRAVLAILLLFIAIDGVLLRLH